MCYVGNWDFFNIFLFWILWLLFLLCLVNVDGLIYNLLVCNYFIIIFEDEIEDFFILIYLSEVCYVFFNVCRKLIVLSFSCCILCWFWYIFVFIIFVLLNNFMMSFDKFCKFINYLRWIFGEFFFVLSDLLMYYFYVIIIVVGMNVFWLLLVDYYFVMSCFYGESILILEWNLLMILYFKMVCGEKYERWCVVV